MKKLFALLLALALVLSFGITAMAAPAENSASKSYVDVVKVSYNLEGATDSTLFPGETLTFLSEAHSDNPDLTKNLVIAPLEVTGNTDLYLTVTVPSYTEVGLYNYTITMNPGSTQGVAYSAEEVYLSVLVTYDYENPDYLLKATLGVTNVNPDGATPEKYDSFTNTYSLGSLTISKEVAGNLASRNQKFSIDVTFESSDSVESTISYGGDKSITPDAWKDGSVTVTVELAHGDSVTFSNIPEGVTYTVVEQAKHEAADPNGSNPETGYTVTYADEKSEGTIAVDTEDTVKVINTKDTQVATGVMLDSLPYILLIAVAVVAVVLFTVRKRRNREV